MNHTEVYNSLMRRAKLRSGLRGYVEKHHIKPKALFPDLKDDPENIVKLTAREHFVAHLLLAKIYGGVMVFAANSMSLNRIYGSRSYEWLRVGAADFLSRSRTGSGNPMFGRKISEETTAKRLATMKERYAGKDSPLKGRKLSDEHRKKLRFAHAEKGSFWSGRSHSDMSKKKISDAKKGVPSPNKGKKSSLETRQKISDSLKGRTVSDDVRSRISASLKGRPKPPRSEAHRRKLSEANRRRSLKKKCP